ncbi:MAG: HD domain-containing protein [Planctomycetes bacterium]|nr:HD domain-containing protein [Planctomycetota bacterium]
MNSQFNPIQTIETVGRLPAPDVPPPIMQESLDELACAFRQFGLWLSLWSSDAECLAKDHDAGAFWRLIGADNNSFHRILANQARLAMQAYASARADSLDLKSTGPLAPSLPIFAIPLRRGARCAGVLLAASITSAEFDEPMLRLCGDLELDRTMLESEARRVQGADHELIAKLIPALACAARQSSRFAKLSEEVKFLTHNLQCTYEELHLIYQISGKMSLNNKPAHVLEMVADELLEVCRAESIAFVLREDVTAPGDRAQYGVIAPALNERIIQIGENLPGPRQLERLAESLAPELTAALPHLLMNGAADHPEIKWTSDWLRHLVVLPLWRNHDLLGVMFAINCTDGGDFTSVDVQLLRAVADRVAPFLENHQLYGDLADLLMGLLHAMVNSIDAKDTYTCGHSERVALYAKSLAQAAHLPTGTCDRIYLAGLLHDVGKIGVPDAILCKTGRLTTEEFDAMKKHPEIGARILSRIRQINDLLPGVLHHHERVDGRGYPDGLAGDEIPLFGKIICIADCFDAMTTNRTYRAAMPLQAALAEVRRCAGTQFDPHLTEAFLALNHEKIVDEARALTSEAGNAAWINDVRPSKGV